MVTRTTKAKADEQVEPETPMTDEQIAATLSPEAQPEATPAPEPDPDPEPEVTPEPVAVAEAAKTMTVVEAMSAVMAHVRAVGKESQAPGQLGGYKFRGIDAVVNGVAPALRRFGVVVVPEVLDVERVVTQSRQGAAMLNVYVRMRYVFHGPDGGTISCTVLGEASDAGDKATAKAQSVAFRVALLQALALPTDDTDPDMENYERANVERLTSYREPVAQTQQSEPQQPSEPTWLAESPAHLKPFWTAFLRLDQGQQQWMRTNWPEGLPDHPNKLTVEQTAVVTELLGQVPPY